MKHIVKFSGGKDSTAMLLMMLERGLSVDEIIFCDTGLEYPEVYEHMKAVEKFTGRQITVLHPPHTFEYFLADIVKTKGEHAGEHGYDWPRRKDQRWCTGQLKEKVAARYLKNSGAYMLYIGIAADEPSRHYRETAKNIQHPLFEWGITEKMALEYCQSKGFDFGGLYKKVKRLGCWCCPFQTKKVLRILRRDYPALWDEMQRLDSKAPNTFKAERSIAEYEHSFALEDKQIKLFGNYKAYKVPLFDLNIDEVKQQYIKYAVQKRKKYDGKIYRAVYSNCSVLELDNTKEFIVFIFYNYINSMSVFFTFRMRKESNNCGWRINIKYLKIQMYQSLRAANKLSAEWAF